MTPQNTREAFFASFAFTPTLREHIGIERERFLTDAEGTPVAASPAFLRETDDPRWTYELSACQVEDRIRPSRTLCAAERELVDLDAHGCAAAGRLGLTLASMEVAPATMPLDVYPDARYLHIAETLPRETLAAACRVAGTHIHVGVGNLAEALRVHNALARRLSEFMRLGDHSEGERLRLYRTMAGQCEGPQYADTDEFFATACAEGWAEHIRNCWHLVRISRHGTVECRAFGATPHVDEVLLWTETVLAVAREEMTHA